MRHHSLEPVLTRTRTLRRGSGRRMYNLEPHGVIGYRHQHQHQYRRQHSRSSPTTFSNEGATYSSTRTPTSIHIRIFPTSKRKSQKNHKIAILSHPVAALPDQTYWRVLCQRAIQRAGTMWLAPIWCGCVCVCVCFVWYKHQIHRTPPPLFQPFIPRDVTRLRYLIRALEFFLSAFKLLPRSDLVWHSWYQIGVAE